MKEVLEFAFSDVWHFIGCCVFMLIIAYWKPIEITILNGRFKEKDNEYNT